MYAELYPIGRYEPLEISAFADSLKLRAILFSGGGKIIRFGEKDVFIAAGNPYFSGVLKCWI